MLTPVGAEHVSRRECLSRMPSATAWTGRTAKSGQTPKEELEQFLSDVCKREDAEDDRSVGQ
jgi:hypothetical protein